MTLLKKLHLLHKLFILIDNTDSVQQNINETEIILLIYFLLILI